MDASEILPPFGRLNDMRGGFQSKIVIKVAPKLTQSQNNFWLNGVITFYIIQDTEQILHRLGAEHGDAGFLEVRDALEHR